MFSAGYSGCAADCPSSLLVWRPFALLEFFSLAADGFGTGAFPVFWFGPRACVCGILFMKTSFSGFFPMGSVVVLRIMGH